MSLTHQHGSASPDDAASTAVETAAAVLWKKVACSAHRSSQCSFACPRKGQATTNICASSRLNATTTQSTEWQLQMPNSPRMKTKNAPVVQLFKRHASARMAVANLRVPNVQRGEQHTLPHAILHD